VAWAIVSLQGHCFAWKKGFLNIKRVHINTWNSGILDSNVAVLWVVKRLFIGKNLANTGQVQ
jgi:hypothetical protein